MGSTSSLHKKPKERCRGAKFIACDTKDGACVSDLRLKIVGTQNINTRHPKVVPANSDPKLCKVFKWGLPRSDQACKQLSSRSFITTKLDKGKYQSVGGFILIRAFISRDPYFCRRLIDEQITLGLLKGRPIDLSWGGGTNITFERLKPAVTRGECTALVKLSTVPCYKHGSQFFQKGSKGMTHGQNYRFC